MNKSFMVGLAKADITPEKGQLVAGSLYPRTFETIKDPLFVKAVVIGTDDNKTAIVTLDLISYTNEDAAKARKSIAEATGILPENVVICASHTHSGPYTQLGKTVKYYLKKEGTYEEITGLHYKYMDRVHEAIKQSVIKANQELEPCRLGIAKGKVEGISHNRRVLKDNNDCWNTWLLPQEERDKWPAAGPIDTDLYVLAAVTENNKVKAVIYNYALHANSNRIPKSISADYPAYVAKEVQNSLGSNVETLFLPGACGNINVTTSSEVIGEKIGQEIVRNIEALDFNIEPVICARNIEIDLPFRDFSHFQEEEISRKWPGGMEFYRNRYEELINMKQKTLKCSLTGIHIGDIAFAFNPSEFFVELGLAIKEGSPFKHTIVVELTNGRIGYMPTKIAYEQGGYETFHGTSMFIPEAGEIIVKETLDILNDLKNGCVK
jgi:neutral ceramidase